MHRDWPEQAIRWINFLHGVQASPLPIVTTVAVGTA